DQWISEHRPKAALKIMTKTDLRDTKPSDDWLTLSAKTGVGLPELKKKLIDLVDAHVGNLGDGAFITSTRHLHALSEARTALDRFAALFAETSGEELLAFELQSAHK